MTTELSVCLCIYKQQCLRVRNIFFLSKKKKKTISTIKSGFKNLKTCLENFLLFLRLHFIFDVVHFEDHGVLSICFASFSLPFVVTAIIVAFVIDSGGGPGSSQVQPAIMERLLLVLVAVVMLLEILCIGCSLWMKTEENHLEMVIIILL